MPPRQKALRNRNEPGQERAGREKSSKSATLEKTIKDPKVKNLITGRARPVLFETEVTNRLLEKDSKRTAVGIYDYDANKSIVAMVDSNTSEVVEVGETEVQFQLSLEEEKEAEGIALQDPRVKKFLKGRKMNSLVRLYFPKNAFKDHPPHRYAIIFLRPSNTERKFAIVDLSTQQLTDLLDTSGITSQ